VAQGHSAGKQSLQIQGRPDWANCVMQRDEAEKKTANTNRSQKTAQGFQV